MWIYPEVWACDSSASGFRMTITPSDVGQPLPFDKGGFSFTYIYIYHFRIMIYHYNYQQYLFILLITFCFDIWYNFNVRMKEVL